MTNTNYKHKHNWLIYPLSDKEICSLQVFLLLCHLLTRIGQLSPRVSRKYLLFLYISAPLHYKLGGTWSEARALALSFKSGGKTCSFFQKSAYSRCSKLFMNIGE